MTPDEQEKAFIEEFIQLLKKYDLKIKHHHVWGFVIQRCDLKYIAQGANVDKFLRHVSAIENSKPYHEGGQNDQKIR